MMILAVTTTKPRANCNIGFSCKMAKEYLIVIGVDADGIFGGTDLSIGQKIIRINGTSVKNLRGGAMPALVACFDSLPIGEVTLIVKSRSYSTEGAHFKFISMTDRTNRTHFRSVMTREIDDIPQILKDACVSRDTWWMIHTLIEEELMPVSLKCIQNNDIYSRGLGNNRAVEKVVHMKAAHTGILHNNVTLVAMAVKDRVSSILAKYSIMAVLAYESITLSKWVKAR